MTFYQKAHYPGPFDNKGIPLLDYKGKIGKQYNPSAIAQYGLGHCNLYMQYKNKAEIETIRHIADWLVANLVKNHAGLDVWMNPFDCEEDPDLKNPWFSAQSQGLGISLLLRAYTFTGNGKYLEGADRAFKVFEKNLNEGGVVYTDKNGDQWIEEFPGLNPVHSLKGAIWALWGIHDYTLIKKIPPASELLKKLVKTLAAHIQKYDCSFWSLSDLSIRKVSHVASAFEHDLHIVLLEGMYKITANPKFMEYSIDWKNYRTKRINRIWALLNQGAFNLLYL